MLRSEIRIVGAHAHAERARPSRDLAADASCTHQTQRLAVQLGAREALPVPLTVLHRAVGRRDPADTGEDERKREFGSGNRVAGGRIEHRDAALRSCIDINVVDADTRATDHLERVGVLQRLARDAGAAAYDDRVRALQRPRQFFALKTRPLDDLEAVISAQRRESLRRDGVCYENTIRSHGDTLRTSAPALHADSRGTRPLIASALSSGQRAAARDGRSCAHPCARYGRSRPSCGRTRSRSGSHAS
jgi:hypothetical protein